MSSSIPPESEFSQADRYARPAPISSDELLPPVEPPSARFIIQLFVVPAVIVAAVVLLWFVIESLARRGEQDPDQIVAALRSSNQARFQRAKELADMLRLPERYPKLKTNRELAQKLAAYLDELVEAGNPSEAEVDMRIIVARSLGDFHVSDGLPALINAAQHDPERDVRRQAINAIAVHAGTMANLKQPLVNEELTEALLELADDQEELIRSETAFALGVAAAQPGADPPLVGKLEELADDLYTDTRFNAATWLARIGSPRAAGAVAEMLDPEAIESSVAGEKAMTEDKSGKALAAAKAFKQKLLITNALKAVNDLLEQESLPAEGLALIEKALERFIDALPAMKLPKPAHDELSDAAERTLAKVKARAARK
jgi:HEAT repeat protein